MAEHETVTKADVDSKVTTHAGVESAHHIKTHDNEVYGLLLTGTDAGKPAAGIANRWYFATDTLILYRDNGTSWVEAARGETVIRLAQLAEKLHASLTGKDADDHTQYLNTTRHDTTTRHALGTVVPHDSLAGLTSKPHSGLTDIGASDHHTKTGDNEVYGLVQAGTAAARPAAGVAKRWYFATDTLILSRDNGTTWDEMARGETAIRLVQLADRDFSSLTGRWTLAQAHRGADDKVMVFKGPDADPVEEDKPAAGWTPTGDGGTKVTAADIEDAAGIPLSKLESAVCSETEADNKIAARVPSGIIVTWHGTIADIPDGYVICDGNNGTPNWLGKFIEGVATAATDPGATGGATSKTTSGHTHTITHPSTGKRTYDGSYPIAAAPGDNASSEDTDSISDIRPLFYDAAFIMKT